MMSGFSSPDPKMPRGAARRGKDVACHACGKKLYVPLGSLGRKKFCSRGCADQAKRIRRIRKCAICGKSYENPDVSSQRRTCSAPCRSELLSRSKAGQKNPAWTGRRHRGESPWVEALAAQCELCGSTRRLQRHHVVYEQHVRRRNGDCFHPDDCLTLCFKCHVAHHQGRGGRIKVSQLRPENLSFARDLLGDYARDYFVRYYDLDVDEFGAPDPLVTEWMPEGDTVIPRPVYGERTRRAAEHNLSDSLERHWPA